MITESNLWELLVEHQGSTYYTSRSIPFTFFIKTGKDGKPGGELFIDGHETVWKQKSITRATVFAAFRRCLEVQAAEGCVSGPKKLGTFGASYLYPIFLSLGVISGPAPAQKNEQMKLEEFQMEETKRTRRTAEESRAAKIAALEEKISKKQAELAEMKQKLEELKRPPKMSAAERQALLKQKIQGGALTEEEAFQLGYKG